MQWETRGEKGSMSYYEHYKRSVAKTITYRIMILMSSFLVINSFIESARVSMGITLISNLASTLLYFAHERIWNLSHWGKRPIARKKTIKDRRG